MEFYKGTRVIGCGKVGTVVRVMKTQAEIKLDDGGLVKVSKDTGRTWGAASTRWYKPVSHEEAAAYAKDAAERALNKRAQEEEWAIERAEKRAVVLSEIADQSAATTKLSETCWTFTLSYKGLNAVCLATIKRGVDQWNGEPNTDLLCTFHFTDRYDTLTEQTLRCTYRNDSSWNEQVAEYVRIWF